MGAVEEIAKVVSDLRRHKALSLLDETNQRLQELALDTVVDPVVVDCTGIYRHVMSEFDADNAIMNYEDHPCIAPPWEEAVFCYVNRHGNVHAMHATALTGEHMPRWETEADTHTIEWDRVRWVLSTFVWLGGQNGQGRALPTCGPAILWRFAIYDDGWPADLAWTHLLPQYPVGDWDIARLVLLGALNFLNCSNTALEDAPTTRPERRRLQRAGADDVRVQTIVVYPAGGKRKAGSGVPLGEGAPLHAVRGHFASYGPKYGRGLLFGKYEGRFFIPAHVRGSAEHGETKPDYRLAADR